MVGLTLSEYFANEPTLSLKQPRVKVCWVFYAKETKTGEVSGGTRTAVELARQYNIPCVNMLHDNWFDRLQKVWREVNNK